MTPLPIRWGDFDQPSVSSFSGAVRDGWIEITGRVCSDGTRWPERRGQRGAALWKKDVFEVFFLTESGGGYVEMNFSPSGEWWGGAFSSPRCGFTPFSDGVVEVVQVERSVKEWQIEARFLYSALTEEFLDGGDGDFRETVRGNICSILYPDSSRSPIYSSYADISTSEPDFHQPEAFVPLPFH